MCTVYSHQVLTCVPNQGTQIVQCPESPVLAARGQPALHNGDRIPGVLSSCDLV